MRTVHEQEVAHSNPRSTTAATKRTSIVQDVGKGQKPPGAWCRAMWFPNVYVYVLHS